jgi:hypothetical protein
MRLELPTSIYLINQRCANCEQAGRSPGATAEKGSAVPRVEEPERIISKAPDRSHCSPKLLLRERLRGMASSFHAVLRRVRDRATIQRRASAHHCARARTKRVQGLVTKRVQS